MAFISPEENTTIYLTKDFNGEKNNLLLKVVHTNSNIKLYWYLNTRFIGTTQSIHELEVLPPKGTYLITVIDEFGNEIYREIEIKE